jgi:N-acetylated-alpha-linked acidic dipeptidase
MSRRHVLAVAAAFLLSATSPSSSHAEGPRSELAGFAPSSTTVELSWESKLRALPSTDRMRESMRRLTAHPHHVGSPYDRDNAEWILARFREAGLDASIEQFQVLFPTPKRRVLELVAPVRFTARLDEPAVAGDPTSGQKGEQLPTYNAYSIDGDVTAPLVYVNYGLPSDYEDLDRLGVSVRGAIVIARYGQSWRGVKPKVAAEHGAVGCILYSDPTTDTSWTTSTPRARCGARRACSAGASQTCRPPTRAIRSRRASARPPTPGASRSRRRRASRRSRCCRSRTATRSRSSRS